ncbi:hypothetical protein EDC04DRAFT_2676267 [Pisolithus marmoratus]|nr:hypothetical protein EDC04DRAFT_2676267 [Pisolithus marmoratus]
MCFGSSFNTGCSWLCAVVSLLETCWSSAVTKLAACFATSRLGRAFLLYVQPWCTSKTPHFRRSTHRVLSRLHIKSLICDGKTRTGCLAMIRSKMGMYVEGGCSSTACYWSIKSPGYFPRYRGVVVSFKGNNFQRSASRCRHPGGTIEDLSTRPTSQQALS